MSDTPFKTIKKRLSNHITLVVVPYGTSKPRQMTMTLSFLIFTLVTWLGVTGWAAYITAQHVDYWHSRLYTQMLNLKIAYLNSRVRQFGEKIDEVKEVELKLEDLLRMGSRKAIIQGDGSWNDPAARGGPTPEDRNRLQRTLQTGIWGLGSADIQNELDRLNQIYQDRLAGYQKIEGWIDKERKLFRATPAGWPASGHVTSHFGLRTDPFTNVLEFHTGIDIGGNWGSPIRSTADGVVAMSGWGEGYGKLVIVNHGFGYSSLYGHMSKILVSKGDRVYRGQVIGLIGATGRTTGPHCHYEVWRYDKTTDPYATMMAREK
jgi:murein DD-endopeptidase MepM/ murein hydrolase activator NlpD